MRIIGGYLKKRKLKFVKNITTRPLRDFVKENLFNILENSNLYNLKLTDSYVLDLFCGVGSFGIECLSRQVKKVFFVDNSQEALNILEENLIKLDLMKRSEIIKSQILIFFKNTIVKNKINLVFLDPPYAEQNISFILNKLKNSNFIKKNALVIIHRESNSDDDLNLLNNKMIRDYGRSRLILGNF